MRYRLVAATVAAAAALSAATSTAQAESIESGGTACVGLTCPESEGGLPAAVQSRWLAPSISGPKALYEQKEPGFYEFGRGTMARNQAVAYVSTPGTISKAPAAILSLQVVRDIPASNFETGTVVIFGSGAAGYVPALSSNPAAQASRATRKAVKRPIARTSAQDAYGCEDHYFCIYGGDSFGGGRYQWHDINYGANGWVQLSDYGINDWANSSRNRRDRDSLLAEHHSGGGDRHCYDSHSSDANFGGWSNDASSLFNTAGDTSC